MGGTDTEERAADSAKRSREETEESASEGETKTAGGKGEVGMTPTVTTEGYDGSGEKNDPGGAVAVGGAT